MMSIVPRQQLRNHSKDWKLGRKIDSCDCTKTWRTGFILAGKSNVEYLEREQNWRNSQWETTDIWWSGQKIWKRGDSCWIFWIQVVLTSCCFKAKSFHCVNPTVKWTSTQSYWMNVFGRKWQKEPCPRSWATADGGKRRTVGGDRQWKREPVMPSRQAGTCPRICQNLGLPPEFKMGH